MKTNKIVQGILKMGNENRDEFEFKSLCFTAKTIEPKLDEEQRKLLEKYLIPPKPIETKDFSIPKVSEYQLQRQELLKLPNLLQKQKIFPKFELKEELLNRSKKENGNNDYETEEHLSDLLAQRSQMLKENTLRFHTEIRKGGNLNNMEERLENINIRVKGAQESIKKVTKKTWKTTFMIWGSILAVICIFAWTFLFLRFISVRK
jgi:hypothetical protein